jgi:hypothetical protein
MTSRRPMLLASLLAAASFACGGLEQPEGDASKYPHPALIGRIDAGLRPADAPDLELDLFVNSEQRHVFVAPDGTFSVKELAGDQPHLEFMLDDLRATTVDLTDLQPGQLIMVELKASASEMHLESLARPIDLREYHLPVRRSGSLELIESDAVFYLDPGEYVGGLEVRGDRVKIFAINQDQACESRPRVRFAGDITVRGNDVEIYDLDTHGQVRLGGSHIRVHSPCDDLWVTDTSPSLVDSGEVTVGPIGIF